jgi:plasmid stabilization system protein ParE
MALQIKFSKRFNSKSDKLTAYLKKEWGQTVAENFYQKLYKKLNTLAHQPHIGKPSETKKNIRSISITKHKRLYYRILNNKIIIVNMFDTRIHPTKNPY